MAPRLIWGLKSRNIFSSSTWQPALLEVCLRAAFNPCELSIEETAGPTGPTWDVTITDSSFEGMSKEERRQKVIDAIHRAGPCDDICLRVNARSPHECVQSSPCSDEGQSDSRPCLDNDNGEEPQIFRRPAHRPSRETDRAAWVSRWLQERTPSLDDLHPYRHCGKRTQLKAPLAVRPRNNESYENEPFGWITGSDAHDIERIAQASVEIHENANRNLEDRGVKLPDTPSPAVPCKSPFCGGQDLSRCPSSTQENEVAPSTQEDEAAPEVGDKELRRSRLHKRLGLERNSRSVARLFRRRASPLVDRDKTPSPPKRRRGGASDRLLIPEETWPTETSAVSRLVIEREALATMARDEHADRELLGAKEWMYQRQLDRVCQHQEPLSISGRSTFHPGVALQSKEPEEHGQLSHRNPKVDSAEADQSSARRNEFLRTFKDALDGDGLLSSHDSLSVADEKPPAKQGPPSKTRSVDSREFIRPSLSFGAWRKRYLQESSECCVDDLPRFRSKLLAVPAMGRALHADPSTFISKILRKNRMQAAECTPSLSPMKPSNGGHDTCAGTTRELKACEMIRHCGRSQTIANILPGSEDMQASRRSQSNQAHPSPCSTGVSPEVHAQSLRVRFAGPDVEGERSSSLSPSHQAQIANRPSSTQASSGADGRASEQETYFGQEGQTVEVYDYEAEQSGNDAEDACAPEDASADEMKKPASSSIDIGINHDKTIQFFSRAASRRAESRAWARTGARNLLGPVTATNFDGTPLSNIDSMSYCSPIWGTGESALDLELKYRLMMASGSIDHWDTTDYEATLSDDDCDEMYAPRQQNGSDEEQEAAPPMPSLRDADKTTDALTGAIVSRSCPSNTGMLAPSRPSLPASPLGGLSPLFEAESEEEETPDTPLMPSDPAEARARLDLDAAGTSKRTPQEEASEAAAAALEALTRGS